MEPELELRHELHGTGPQCIAEAHLLFRRDATRVFGPTAERFQAMLAKHIAPSAVAKLPAVAALAALNNTAASITADLDRVELDRRQASLDQQKLMSGGGSGEKLAVDLGNAQAAEQAAEQRLQQARSGVRAFEAKVAQAGAAASQAVRRHFDAVILPQLRTEVAELEAAVRRRLAQALPTLDELAAIEQLSMLLGTGAADRVAAHLEEALRKATTK
jgi:hypothetical protein